METSCGYDGDMTGCRYTVVVASSLSTPIPHLSHPFARKGTRLYKRAPLVMVIGLICVQGTGF